MRMIICALTVLSLSTQTAASPHMVKAYDQAFAAYEAKNPRPPDNSAGSLAWGEAAVLEGLLSMYEGTGNEAYLRKFVERAMIVADLRDSKAGVKDYTGKSRPAWLSGGNYTYARARISDKDGIDVIDIRLVGNSRCGSSILSLKGIGANRYQLRVKNEPLNIEETHELAPARDWFEEINLTSKLLRISDIGWLEKRSALLEVAEFKATAELMAFTVHTGVIAGPLARFAVIVNERKLAEFEVEAAFLAEVARRAVESHEAEWCEREDYGSYLYPLGAPFWADGAPVPQNYSCAVGAVYAWLYKLYGKPEHRARVVRIARTLKNDMQSVSEEEGPYIWHYWWGPMVTGWKPGEFESESLNGYVGNKAVEDVSHAGLDVHLVCLASEIGVVFDDKDLDRLAKTLSQNVIKSPTELAWRVDGTPGAQPRTILHPKWMHLVRLRPELLPLVKPFADKMAQEKTTISQANMIAAYLTAGGR